MNKRQSTLVTRLAVFAALGAACLAVQAQTTVAAADSCATLRGKLDDHLANLRSLQSDQARLRAIIRVYDDARQSSILPTSGTLVRMDTVHERAAANVARIEALTMSAGATRTELKRCEKGAVS